MAPSIVGESLKGAELVAEVMQNKLGLPCNPPPGSHRTDIIQAVQCGTRKKVDFQSCYCTLLLFHSAVVLLCCCFTLLAIALCSRCRDTFTVLSKYPST